ncbi:unnamed protein product [Microthlaspi erraticum]|uniref:Retrotransposon gag domain-containing protein n=1 Tax=Microthlaspi erraticum TaxID=1685480 RepID=A0A6D2HX14_9BRAS|nr:unnamed protein product [Microthlaspi erraticum]
MRDGHKPSFSAGPWPTPGVGREHGHRLKDGGGDWNVRPIGTLQNENHSNNSTGDFRVQKGGGLEYSYEEKGHSYETCVVPPAKMEFPPYDGTTNAIEWLQKCDDYFHDQRVFNDDAKVRDVCAHWKSVSLEQQSPEIVDEYCSQLEECLGRHTRLTGDQQLWQFCAVLTDRLRKEVEYLRPETIFEAMEYARDNEYKIDNDNRARTFGGHLAPSTKYFGGGEQEEAKQAPPKKYLKKLTSAEMAE